MKTSTKQFGNIEIGIVEHNGQKFEALGFCVGEGRIAAYLGKDGRLTKWDGEVIGSYRITATWKTPHSYLSSTMHQVYATVNGRQYTGRSAGVGMLFRGRQVSVSGASDAAGER